MARICRSILTVSLSPARAAGALFGLLLALPALAADAPYLSSVETVHVGHWLEVRGELTSSGAFAGDEAALLQPQKESVLIGTVPAEERDPTHFRLLGQAVTTNSSTSWRGLAPAAIGGARVKVEGQLAPDGSFAASIVATRGEGRDRVGGRVDALRREGDVLVARILELDVRLPAAVEHEEPLDAISEKPAPSSIYRRATRDEEDQFGDGVTIGTSLRFGGQLELDAERDRELDLDATEDLDETNAAVRARLRLDWQPPGGRITGAIEARGQEQWTFAEAGDEARGDATLGETYLAFELAKGGAVELVVGRQDFDDEREWIYDTNLDAVRLLAEGERVRFELGVGTTLFDGSPREEKATTLVAMVANADRKRRLAGWAMYQEIDLAVPETMLHAGLRAGGNWIPDTESWLELAIFRGERELAGQTLDLAGWAFDVGLTAEPDWLEPFAFTVGYAWGSGGEITATNDDTFRQTGLQDNNDKFAGVTSFRYYGELSDPELANLRILTAGVGVRFAKKSSLDLVWHAYAQDAARRRLIDTDIDARADGVHTDLGWEADLVFGSRELSWFDLELVAAYFNPGAAFPADAEDAWLGKAQVRFRF